MNNLWQKLKVMKYGLKDLNTYIASYNPKLLQVKHELEITKDLLNANPFSLTLIEWENILLGEIKK